ALQTAGAPMSYAALRERRGAVTFPGLEHPLIQPPRDDRRFRLAPPDVLEEIAALCADLAADLAAPATAASDAPNQFQLTVRRHRETNNSTGADFEATWARLPGNPAYLNPADMARLGLKAGELVEIARGETRIIAPVAADTGLRPGVVS